MARTSRSRGSPAEKLAIKGSEHPIAVLEAVWQWLEATPALGIEAVILGVAAGSLALVARGADLTIASFVGCLLAGTLLVAPDIPAFPLVVTGWATYLALTVMSRRLPERSLERRTFGTLLRQTRAHFSDRLKAAGGPRWPSIDAVAQAIDPWFNPISARRGSLNSPPG